MKEKFILVGINDRSMPTSADYDRCFLMGEYIEMFDTEFEAYSSLHSITKNDYEFYQVIKIYVKEK